MMLYGWREREEVLRFFEAVTGLRMNHNYIRARRRGRRPARRLGSTRCSRHPRHRRAASPSTTCLLTGQPDLARAPAGRGRDHDRGGPGARRHRADPALHRRTPWDLRRDHAVPRATTRSTSTSSSAPTATASTATRSGSARSASRCASCARSSTRCPTATTASRTRRSPAAPRPHRRVDGSPHPPLQDLHRGLQGARGRGLRGGRDARGELGCYIVVRRLGQALPRCTSGARPSCNLQTLPHLMHGGLPRRRRRHHLVGRPDHGRGGPLMARVTPEQRRPLAPRRSSPRYPRTEVGDRSRSCTSRRSRTATSPTTRWQHIAELVDVTSAEVLGTASFYEMFKRRARRHATRERLHQHRAASCSAARSCCTTPSRPSASAPAAPPPTACSPSRTSSASRRAPRRPASRSTTATSTGSPTDELDQLIDELRAGALDDVVPPHGTSARSASTSRLERTADTGYARAPRPVL